MTTKYLKARFDGVAFDPLQFRLDPQELIKKWFWPPKLTTGYDGLRFDKDAYRRCNDDGVTYGDAVREGQMENLCTWLHVEHPFLTYQLKS